MTEASRQATGARLGMRRTGPGNRVRGACAAVWGWAVVGVVLVVLVAGACAAAKKDTCTLTEKTPKHPSYELTFCTMFPDKACCLPAHDAEIEEFYLTLMDAGPLCLKDSTRADLLLRTIYCFACSPDHPKYLSTDNTGAGTVVTITVCNSLAKHIEPQEFDDCGMVVVEERGNVCLGDDTVVPSQNWGKGRAGVVSFLNDDAGGKPPYFENSTDTQYVVRVVDDDSNEPCYSRAAPGLGLRPPPFTTLLFSSAFLPLLLAASVAVQRFAGH